MTTEELKAFREEKLPGFITKWFSNVKTRIGYEESITAYDDEIKDLITRLNRIEGQIRGIHKMVDEGAYCVDILTQVNAARCSLNSFSKVLLGSHIKSCVKDDVRNGSEEKIDELVELLQKMMK
jgi:DNA-binding FrmR family transcriptional regulator